MPTQQNPPPNSSARPGLTFVLLLGGLWAAILARDMLSYRSKVETIPYSEFLTLLEQRQVSEAMVSESTVHGRVRTPLRDNVTEFLTLRLEDPKLSERLGAAGVQRFGAAPDGNLLRDLLSWVVPGVVMVGLERDHLAQQALVAIAAATAVALLWHTANRQRLWLGPSVAALAIAGLVVVPAVPARLRSRMWTCLPWRARRRRP